MADSIPIKKPRGNPNFKRKQQPTNTEHQQMAEEKPDTTTEAPEKKTPPAEPTATPPPADTTAAPVDKLPDDLFSDKIPGKETLPLDGEVKTKSYASLPDSGATPPPPKPGEPVKPFDEAGGGTGPSTPPAPVEKPLTPEEINSQANQTVEMMFRGYEKLHALGRWYGKVDMNDLSMLQADDKINLQQHLPVGNKTITVLQFFETYNTSIDENVSVSQKFKDDIRPALVRIIVKNNWLLNDEMFVGLTVVDDIVTKTSMLVALKKTSNMVLKACMDIKTAEKAKADEIKKPNITVTPPPSGDGTQQPAEDAEWEEPNT